MIHLDDIINVKQLATIFQDERTGMNHWYKKIRESVIGVFTRPSGQDLTEYALLVALVAIVVVVAVVFFGTQVSTFLQGIGDTVGSWLSPT